MAKMKIYDIARSLQERFPDLKIWLNCSKRTVLKQKVPRAV